MFSKDKCVLLNDTINSDAGELLGLESSTLPLSRFDVASISEPKI